MLLTANSSTPVKVAPSRPTSSVGRAKNIKIDGKLEDWDGIKPIILNDRTPDAIQYRNSEYKGADDCSAEMRFAWDEKFLYIAAKVKDDKHFQPVRDSQVWSGDCIQFAVIDGGPLPVSRSQEVSALNEFAISADKDGGYVYSWCTRENGLQSRSPIAVSGGDGEIVYEVAIPWQDINVARPASGKRLGLSFVVADNDGDGLRGWLEWTPGIFYFKNASAYGILTLE